MRLNLFFFRFVPLYILFFGSFEYILFKKKKKTVFRDTTLCLPLNQRSKFLTKTRRFRTESCSLIYSTGHTGHVIFLLSSDSIVPCAVLLQRNTIGILVYYKDELPAEQLDVEKHVFTAINHVELFGGQQNIPDAGRRGAHHHN